MLSRVNFRIKTIYNILRPSEKKVADYILNYLDSYEEMSMISIAKSAGVSQPTIMRFVKAIGFNSFKQFKYELVRSNTKSVDLLYGFSINKDDDIRELPSKIIATITKMMEDSLKSISIDNYLKTIDLINQTNNISIYAVENSMCVANDLMTKLIYLGKNVTFHSDYYLQSIDASNLKDQDLAIGISYSGNSKNTVEVLKIAKENGAKTIAIVNFENTMLTKYGNVVLSTSNDQFLYGDAIFSRATQIALVDMIYMGIIMSDYEYYTNKLDLYSKLIKHHGFQKNEIEV
ncbi:MurR/RpiR family transcriptional regulator [Thomasclavelia sp.]|uniref:MurR/RpiR family transcriptional regulator n=1 Tax=Thomasclavelia sp. TaxID=3025757 RepID=UPI0039A24C14